MLTQVAEGVLVHESDFIQSNSVIVPWALWGTMQHALGAPTHR